MACILSLIQSCGSGDCATEQANQCLVATCPSNSQCVATPDSYSCVCLPGYTGESCAVQIYSQHSLVRNVEACTKANCSYSGECVYVSGSSFNCNCSDGFTGARCETALDFDNCTEPDCTENEICVGNNCVCVPGYTGEMCETLVCMEDTDCAFGSCVNRTCKCDHGYEGASCGEVVTTMQSNVYGMTTGAVTTTVIWQSNIAGAVSGTIAGGVVFLLCLLLVFCKIHRRKAHKEERGKAP